MKTCRLCGETKTVHEFTANDNRCKSCNRERARQYREKYPDRVRASGARHRKGPNRERYLARRRAWRDANREVEVERMRRWREANRDRLRAYDRHHAADKLARWHEWRARQMGAGSEPVSREEVYERDSGICHLCGGFVEWKDYHLDHLLPVSLGGVHAPWNVAVAHARCNISKGNRQATLRLSIYDPGPVPAEIAAELRGLVASVPEGKAVHYRDPAGGAYLVTRLPAPRGKAARKEGAS